MSELLYALSKSLTTDTYPWLFGIGIGRIVVIQAEMLVCAIIGTVIFQLSRTAWIKKRSQQEKLYAEIIIDLLFADTADPSDPASGQKTVLTQLPFWYRGTYRDVLLDQIHVLSGSERDVLVKHYLAMGFFIDDGVSSQSRSWWKRLTAVIRLDTICLPIARQILLQRLNDRNHFVALAATRALSRLPGANDSEILFQSLERVGSGRRDSLIEILTNIGTYFGPEVLSNYLLQCSSPEMAIACVHVLGSLRASPAVPALINALTNSARLEDALLAEILTSISLIADPQAIAVVQTLLEHPTPLVRARAVTALIALGDFDSFERIRAMKDTETSIEVQRAIKALDEAAA